MFLADRTVPSRQTFSALRRTAELSSDWLIGVRRLLHCAVFVVAAQCDWFSSALCLSSQPVAFIIAVCFFGVVSFCGVSCSCFLVDLFPCPLVCVGMLSS